MPTDSNSNPVIQTTTPSGATPPPAVPAVEAQAVVSVNPSGQPVSGQTTTDIQLMLGNQVIEDVPIDLSTLQQGANLVPVYFNPPTDSNLLGVLPLTVTVNASQSVQETDYSNNSYTTNVDTLVTCDAEQVQIQLKNRTKIPFFPQVGRTWSSELYGIPSLSTVKNSTIGLFGCSISDLAMLFDWDGITRTPIGSPLDPKGDLPGLGGQDMDPGSLNYAMANYEVKEGTKGSVGFNGSNNLRWDGAAQVADASHQGVVTYISDGRIPTAVPNDVYTTLDSTINAIQNEICAGNPVILEAYEPGSSSQQHFMLAKAILFDSETHLQTLELNNPGTVNGQNQLYENISKIYPWFSDYVIYHNSLSDPSSIDIYAPTGVEIMVTDPSGNRTGYDASTQTNYAEIPGADYDIQSINTPADPGFAPETLVQERYFRNSTNVLDGTYTVTVYSLTGGSYYLDYASFDSSGDLNDTQYRMGTLAKGQSTTVTIVHSSTPVPPSNANLTVYQYAIRKDHKIGYAKSKIEIAGKIKPLSSDKLAFGDVKIMIGGLTGYTLAIPSFEFKSRSIGWLRKEPEYWYHHDGTEISISDSGEIRIEIRDADLSALDPSQFDSLEIDVGATNSDKGVSLNCDKNSCRLHNLWQGKDGDRDH